MRRDARQRVLIAITTVMEDYGVVYEHVRKSHHPAVRFTVGDQTRTLTYGGGDPRAHMNARSQARRMLHELGLQPVQHQQLHNSQLAQEYDDGTSPVDTLDVVVEGLSLMETGPDQPIGDTQQSDVVEEAINEQPDVREPEQSDLQPENTAPDIPDPEIKRFVNGDYVLFNTIKHRVPAVQLAQNRFIAVKLDRDLLVQKGHYLVIPIDVPDVVWDMPEHEYKSCFTLAASPTPPAVVEPTVVEQQQPPIQSASDASPVVPAAPPPATDEVPPIDDEDDDDEEQGEEDFEPEAVASPRAAQFPPPRGRPSPAEPRRGVSPQMGRVLLAMLYLQEIKNETEVAGNAIQNMLSPVDARQVSGMLSGGIRMRYVTRGTTLDGGRGSHYILNAAGKKVARKLGTWPYDHRDLAVPPWLREMMRSMAGEGTTRRQ